MWVRAIILFAFLLLGWASPAFAQEPESLEQLIVQLYGASVRIVGLAAFLMLLYAGIRRMLGHVQESNNIILDAIVGTVLLLSSVVILNSINPDLVRQDRPVLDPARFNTRPLPQNESSILPIIIQ